MDEFDEFAKDLEENNKQGTRADVYKLKNGDNRIVLLTNPVGFSELFGIGMVYEGCGYAQYTGRRYKSYVLDLADDQIKIANFSYTTAKLINDLRLGARTKFETLPCPYVMNLKTENAGKKEIKTSVIADEDYKLTPVQLNELATLDSIRDIIERLKNAQKKKVDSDPVLQQKIADTIKAKEEEYAARKTQDSSMAGGEVPTVSYDEPEGEIPF